MCWVWDRVRSESVAPFGVESKSKNLRRKKYLNLRGKLIIKSYNLLKVEV